MRWLRVSRMALVALLIAIAINVALSTMQALHFEQQEVAKIAAGAKGYVSDEVWYVDAARNILRKIFGLMPRMTVPSATLVYSNDSLVIEAKSLAPRYGIRIVSDSYTKISALYVEANSIEAIEEFAKATGAADIVFGWMLGDAQGINEYLNLEHPPMVKYIIALTMLLLGDRPFFWRIPSIVMGALLVFFSFLIALEISKSENLAIIAATLVAVDPLVRNLASLALLDIYVATFTALALLIAIRGRLKEGALLIGFASTFKFTALLAIVPLILLAIKRVAQSTRKFINALLDSVYYLLLTILAFAFFQVLVSAPLILYLGFDNWIQNSILGAISWHLSVKCTGSGCPPASAPWDWFFGINAFPLYIEDSRTIAAAGLVPLYIVAFVLMIVVPPYLARLKPRSRDAWLLLVGLFLGYVALWLAGSRTQYSFYAVQLAPYIHIFIVAIGFELLDREKLVELFRSWLDLLAYLWGALLQLFEESTTS